MHGHPYDMLCFCDVELSHAAELQQPSRNRARLILSCLQLANRVFKPGFPLGSAGSTYRQEATGHAFLFEKEPPEIATQS